MSSTRTETWKPIPGFSSYEASDMGHIRSVDRVTGGRQLRGVVLKPRKSNRGYLLVNLTGDGGVKQTRTVHSLVLAAFVGPCPPGQETLHFNDNPEDNRWPGNLGYGTHPENVIQRPKPVKRCVRCQGDFEGNGRRCHDCVVVVGQEAARRLAAGGDLDQVATALDYPSVTGVWRLAVKYGDARVVVGEAGPPPRSWLHRVMATFRAQNPG
jgi:hypothetical protein